MSQVDRENGETALLGDKFEIKQPSEPIEKTLERVKLVDGAGLVLFLRLVRRASKFGGDPFRIWWQMREGKKCNRGVSATASTEELARGTWKSSVEEAKKAGWREVPILKGGRHLKIRPIPAPRKKTS